MITSSTNLKTAGKTKVATLRRQILRLGLVTAACLGITSGPSMAENGALESAFLDGVPEGAKRDAETGIALAPGLKATVFADEIGQVRHIVVGQEGWLYGALRRPQAGMGGVALKDRDGDGKAEEVRFFGAGLQGTGIALFDGHLYFGADREIVRWNLRGSPVPSGEPQKVVTGFPNQRSHRAKSITFDDRYIYVNVGVPSNACMVESRTKGSPGQLPCPELEDHGSVFRFEARKLGQDFYRDRERYSTGHRNAVALEWNKAADSLYLVNHGRDQLFQFFPEYYTSLDSAELPAEEFHRVEKDDDLGWPYSYYDHRVGERKKMPEYGGDGIERADKGKKPILGFPGHWAPNDLIFLSDQQPSSLAHGALIAFHGSWNRAPEVQAGYKVVFVPMDAKGAITGRYVTLIDGFAGDGPVRSPRRALHRPMGLAEGPDGAIYVSSLMSGGRIWRVEAAADKASAAMGSRSR